MTDFKSETQSLLTPESVETYINIRSFLNDFIVFKDSSIVWQAVRNYERIELFFL